jgi:hypothetical protein
MNDEMGGMWTEAVVASFKVTEGDTAGLPGEIRTGYLCSKSKTLKMEATWSSKMLVSHPNTIRHHNQEDLAVKTLNLAKLRTKSICLD